MSTTKTRPVLTVAEVSSYLHDKGVSDDCELCGHANWGLPPLESQLMLLPTGGFDLTNVRLGDLQALKVAYMLCRHCGNVRTFAFREIERWRESKDSR